MIWRRPKDVGRLQSNTGWTSARLGWCCSHQSLTRGSLASARNQRDWMEGIPRTPDTPAFRP